MYSHTRNECGNINTRCLYCFTIVASDVATEDELQDIETRHLCPEKALTRLLALERTAITQNPPRK